MLFGDENKDNELERIQNEIIAQAQDLGLQDAEDEFGETPQHPEALHPEARGELNDDPNMNMSPAAIDLPDVYGEEDEEVQDEEDYELDPEEDDYEPEPPQPVQRKKINTHKNSHLGV
eukprot:UN32717